MLSLSRHFVFVVALLMVSPLLAQRGDKPGEAMPLPANIVIPPAPPLPVDEALGTFRLAPGFKIEAVAAEPLVHDPVAFTFGPDGRLWVVEMRGYMPNVDGKGEDAPVGSVSVLEDTNGDGRMDKRTVFLDGLVMPRAIALVDDGVLVAAPPRLWFCRDTNGDGIADEKTVVAEDYGMGNNPELAPNGLLRALDNWIYNANHTVRFRSEGSGKFRREDTISRGQWGIAQDDIGRLYFNHNTSPLHGELVPAEYLARNRALGTAGADVELATTNLRVWPGRVTPGVNRGYKTLREDGTLAAVTACCGPAIYRGGLFPAEFAGNAFVCEPAANLVKRLILREENGAMEATNAYPKTEFLTSTDERFRPVNLGVGPDGALYVADMYRGVIQHRTYVTSYLRKQIEDRKLEAPIGLGRIYRVTPEGKSVRSATPRLDRATTSQLAAALGDANGWRRDTAQRLLVERKASDSAKVLNTLATNLRANPLGRLHALWTLEGLNALEPATVLRAIDDEDSRVRAAAVRLAARWLGEPRDAQLVARVLRLAGSAGNEPPSVRLAVTLALGQLRTPDGDAAMRDLLMHAGTQTFLPEAAISGLVGRELELVEAFAHAKDAPALSVSATNAIELATTCVLKSGDVAWIDRVLATIGESSSPATISSAILAGVAQFAPLSPDGRVREARLPAEPKPLVALAAQKSALGHEANQLLGRLRWPGKPGAVAATTAATAEEKARFEKGRKQYEVLCATCHQPDGQGKPGVAAPLVGSRWATGDERTAARIVLNGKATGNLAMPGLRAILDDEAIAAALTYVRASWGNTERAIAPATVAEARAATARRDEPWSNGELEELLQQLPSRRRSY